MAGIGNSTVSAFADVADGTLAPIGSSPFANNQTAPCWTRPQPRSRGRSPLTRRLDALGRRHWRRRGQRLQRHRRHSGRAWLLADIRPGRRGPVRHRC